MPGAGIAGVGSAGARDIARQNVSASTLPPEQTTAVVRPAPSILPLSRPQGDRPAGLDDQLQHPEGKLHRRCDLGIADR